MSVKGISDQVLKNDLVPALKLRLDAVERTGIDRQTLREIMKGVLGFWPSAQQFTQVMWVVGYNTDRNGTYFAQGFGPQIAKEKPKGGKQNQGQSLEWSGKLHASVSGVDANGNKIDFSSKSVKKIIVYFTLLLIILPISGYTLGLW